MIGYLNDSLKLSNLISFTLIVNFSFKSRFGRTKFSFFIFLNKWES